MSQQPEDLNEFDPDDRSTWPPGATNRDEAISLNQQRNTFRSRLAASRSPMQRRTAYTAQACAREIPTQRRGVTRALPQEDAPFREARRQRTDDANRFGNFGVTSAAPPAGRGAAGGRAAGGGAAGGGATGGGATPEAPDPELFPDGPQPEPEGDYTPPALYQPGAAGFLTEDAFQSLFPEIFGEPDDPELVDPDQILGSGLDFLPPATPDTPDPSAPGASGLGPPIPTGGATGGGAAGGGAALVAPGDAQMDSEGNEIQAGVGDLPRHDDSDDEGDDPDEPHIVGGENELWGGGAEHELRRLLTCADYSIILPQAMNCGDIREENECSMSISYSPDNGYNHCEWTNGVCTKATATGNATGTLVYLSDPDIRCGTSMFNTKTPTADCLSLTPDSGNTCGNYYSEATGINCCSMENDEHCFRPSGDTAGTCGELSSPNDIGYDYQCFYSSTPDTDDCNTYASQAGCLINRNRCTWNPDDNTCQDGEDPLRRSLREPSSPPPVINGCTDPSATNYNPDATQDDGSCQLPMCGPINLNSPKINKNLCGEIKNQTSCENAYFTLKLPSKDQHTYKCVWDERGISPGTSGGACSAYIGETTTYNQDNGGTPPTTEELSQLLHKCEFLTAAPSYHTCTDYITSLCNNDDNIETCMEQKVCSGTNPITNGPLIGTNGNFNVSPEMAEACGGGLPGRFGSRPNPDPGFEAVPYSSRGDDRPGYQIRNFKSVLNGACGRLGISQRPVWDRAPFTGKTANNQDFYDNLRRGAPGYYCTYTDVTNQVSDCNSGFQTWSGAWTDEDDKRDTCNTRYTNDYYECDWEPGTFYGDCNKSSSACSGEANSSTYDCPSYSNNTMCNLYSDHCVWNSPTTRPENAREMRASYGFNMPPGIRREATTINVPGSCTAK